MARLLSLDVMRGMTVAGMILVNNGYGQSFHMLQHSRWNGLTPCDLVFPFFLFIMGVSCYLSLSRQQFRPSGEVLWKILKRSVLLFAIGLFINWFDHAVEGYFNCFAHLRIWAVMQRIALSYLAVSLLALYVSHRHLPFVAIACLVVYSVLLLVGHGYDYDAATNIVAQTDLRLFGYDHLYHKSPVDPEGLLATISSVAHVLTGFLCGTIVSGRAPSVWPSCPELTTPRRKALCLFAVGTLLLLAGWLLSFGMPLNKRIWSPSYALATCGMASLMLALLVCAIDVRPLVGRRVLLFFSVFGVNALALYVSSELLAVVFHAAGLSSLVGGTMQWLLPVPQVASLAYALLFVGLNFLIGYALHRAGIIVKL